VKLRI
jgi:hypothetical protein